MLSPVLNSNISTVFAADFKAVYKPVQILRHDLSPMIRLSSIANNRKTCRKFAEVLFLSVILVFTL